MSALFGHAGVSPDGALVGMAAALAQRRTRLVAAEGVGHAVAAPRLVRRGGLLFAWHGHELSRRAPEALLDDVERLGLDDAARGWEGAFVVALIDPRARTVSLVRDPTGQRVVYWTRTRGGLAFASRVRQLLARTDVEPALDLASLVRFLTFSYVPGEATLARGVREVPPGTRVTLSFDGDESSRAQLYLPVEPEGVEGRDPALLVPEIRVALDDAVRRSIEATDGPLCAFLSGGIDSSAVVAIARSQGAITPCYSIAFGDDLPNELTFSAAVARRAELEHRVVTVSAEDMASHVEETVFFLDDPIGDPLTVPNFLLSARAADDGFERALNGEGGDPNFGGPKNIPMLLAEWYGDGTTDGRVRAYMAAYRKLHDDLPRLVDPGVLAEALRDEPIEAPLVPWFASGMKSFLNTLQLVNLREKGGHLILPKVEKMYGASGLVPLSPLFERRVTDVAFATPPLGKLRGNVEKWALKEAVRDLVPDEVVLRKKRGMGVPVHAWLERELAPLAAELLGPAAQARRGLFQPAALDKLRGYRGALRTKGNYGQKVWLLLVAEVWMRLFLDGGARRHFHEPPALVAA